MARSQAASLYTSRLIPGAYGYARVSVGAQGVRCDLAAQVDTIRQCARRIGAAVEGIFEDRDTPDGNRRHEALFELIETLRQNRSKLVIVASIEALGDDVLFQECVLGYFRKVGISVVSAAEPALLETDPTRALLRRFGDTADMLDRQLLVRRLFAARQRKKASEGRCEGTKPYGQLEGEAAAVEMMKTMWSAGKTMKEIAAALDRAGIKPRLGTNWHKKSVFRILDRARSLDPSVPAGRSRRARAADRDPSRTA